MSNIAHELSRCAEARPAGRPPVRVDLAETDARCLDGLAIDTGYNRKYEDKILKGGDTVRINTIGDFTINTAHSRSANMTLNAINATDQTLVMDREDDYAGPACCIRCCTGGTPPQGSRARIRATLASGRRCSSVA